MLQIWTKSTLSAHNKLYLKCPPLAWTNARSLPRHWSVASLIIDCSRPLHQTSASCRYNSSTLCMCLRWQILIAARTAARRCGVQVRKSRDDDVIEEFPVFSRHHLAAPLLRLWRHRWRHRKHAIRASARSSRTERLRPRTRSDLHMCITYKLWTTIFAARCYA